MTPARLPRAQGLPIPAIAIWGARPHGILFKEFQTHVGRGRSQSITAVLGLQPPNSKVKGREGVVFKPTQEEQGKEAGISEHLLRTVGALETDSHLM